MFSYNGKVLEGLPVVQDGIVGHLKGDNLNTVYLLGPVEGLDDEADWDFESAPALSGFTEGVRLGINNEYDEFFKDGSYVSDFMDPGFSMDPPGSPYQTRPRITYGSKDIIMGIYWRNRLLYRRALPESLGLELAGYFQAALPRGLAVRFITETKGPRPPTAKDMVDTDNWLETMFRFAMSVLDFVADIPDSWTYTNDEDY